MRPSLRRKAFEGDFIEIYSFISCGLSVGFHQVFVGVLGKLDALPMVAGPRKGSSPWQSLPAVTNRPVHRQPYVKRGFPARVVRRDAFEAVQAPIGVARSDLLRAAKSQGLHEGSEFRPGVRQHGLPPAW